MMRLPRVITHKNMGKVLDALSREEYFRPGSTLEYDPKAWYYRPVTLEFPLGELAKDMFTTFALVGARRYDVVPLTGKEGFAAHGLEGKVRARMPLLNALYNLRDLLPKHRGRILVE